VRAEVEFFERFLTMTEGLTSVIISHRFSTVRRADQIIVLEDGAIVGMGRHDELLDSSPTYREIVESQLTVGVAA